MGIPSLFAVHGANAAATPRSGRADNEGADSAGHWTSIAEAVAVAGDPSTAGTPPNDATPEEPGTADPGAAMTERAAPFDLPAFLQVLPKAGTAVAVAAAREPVIAAALRRLPVGEAPESTAVSSRPVSAQEGASLRLPAFLVPVTSSVQARTESVPTTAATAATTSSGTTDPQPGAMAALRGALQSMLPTRQTAASPGSPTRSAARESDARGIEPTRSAHRRVGDTRAQTALGALLAANTASGNPTSGNTTSVNAPPAGATPPAAALHATNAAVPHAAAPVMSDLSGLSALSISSAAMTFVPSATPAGPGSADGLLGAPLGSEGWHEQLGAQLSVMAMTGGESEAVMKLAPEELGELEIRVLIRDGEAALQFGAANAEARQAIEAAQPRLRELFASQGMAVSNFSVFSSLSGNPQSSSRHGESASRARRGDAVVHEDMQVRVSGREAQGIVDLYA